jgi:hypothetical protein
MAELLEVELLSSSARLNELSNTINFDRGHPVVVIIELN